MKRGLFVFVFVSFFSTLFGVNLLNKDSVLLIIDGKDITVAEFERIYKKNNSKESQLDAKSMEEYLELFINFKLKVMEAVKQGLDTSKSFKTELSGYRKQLTKPYLVDKDIDEALMKEAYDRMKYDVEASHILIKLDANASPKDTLDAYNKIMKARKRLIDGEAFDVVAKEMSEDPSAKDNGGYLGYFTAFQMVYPFESAAFNTEPGKISNPFKTSFGFHVVKVLKKRLAVGEVKVAHIMVTTPKGISPDDEAKAKTRIFEVYEKLKAGGDFVTLARENSDDKGTASRGGDLPWFGTGRMVPEFEKAAFALAKNGDYSEPVKTSFGWHIIKRIEKKEIGAYDDVKADIKNKISKDERADRSRQAVIAKLKTEYDFREFGDEAKTKGKKKKDQEIVLSRKNIEDFYTVVTDSIFHGKWQESLASGLTKNIFSIGDSVYTQKDFTAFIMKFNRKGTKMPIQELVDQKYKEFIDNKVIKYEEDRLEQKYADFKYLMNEYHDGILLFELTDRMVWSKAMKDTIGLKDFYEQNKAKYMWDTRYDLSVYTCKTEKILAKAYDKVSDAKKPLSFDETMKLMNKKDTSNMKIAEKGRFLKGENKIVDLKVAELAQKKSLIFKNKNLQIVEIKLIDPMPKSIDEAKGLITADYQTFLEDKWISELRTKYKPVVNKDALKLVK
ncbi:MAG: hypothetical protein A2309_06205 [Bacteroidetes bacterium RIFOXYB2_FULL_35_7]|nr:MAG: hypothetical protein A2309_06205 [Bacteroidetes bacterium RIFOXYB2_FULL_35_7]